MSHITNTRQHTNIFAIFELDEVEEDSSTDGLEHHAEKKCKLGHYGFISGWCSWCRRNNDGQKYQDWCGKDDADLKADAVQDEQRKRVGVVDALHHELLLLQW